MCPSMDILRTYLSKTLPEAGDAKIPWRLTQVPHWRGDVRWRAIDDFDRRVLRTYSGRVHG